MKNLLITLFLSLFLSGCAAISKKGDIVVQTKEVKLYFVKTDNSSRRWINGEWVVTASFLYKSEDKGITYSFEHFKGWFFTYDEKR
jgi:uncharacterized protein YceK